jgi:hypothetical protein
VVVFEQRLLAFPQAQLVGFPPEPSSSIQGSLRTATPNQRHEFVHCYRRSGRCGLLYVARSSSHKPSHMECGAACLARGTPLAIATEDGTLYFPAVTHPSASECRMSACTKFRRLSAAPGAFLAMRYSMSAPSVTLRRKAPCLRFRCFSPLVARLRNPLVINPVAQCQGIPIRCAISLLFGPQRVDLSF